MGRRTGQPCGMRRGFGLDDASGANPLRRAAPRCPRVPCDCQGPSARVASVREAVGNVTSESEGRVMRAMASLPSKRAITVGSIFPGCSGGLASCGTGIVSYGFISGWPSSLLLGVVLGWFGSALVLWRLSGDCFRFSPWHRDPAPTSVDLVVPRSDVQWAHLAWP